MAAKRTYDIVMYGATGFTGRLTAEYLATHMAASKLRWAIAGRNREKLDAVKRGLLAFERKAESLGVLEANAESADSLESLARSTRVVITTVGPYARYGEPLVAACARAGTDYVDLTGEPEFVDRMLERYDDTARQSGARIVHCCGFDSIPHDLGAYFTVKQLPPDRPIVVEGFVRGGGSFSGGTWASALGAFADAGPYLRRRMAKRGRRAAEAGRKVRPAPQRLHYEKELGAWACPLPTIDPQIVIRSARALSEYGPDFQYGHFAEVRSLGTVIGGVMGIGALVALAQIGPARRALERLRPSGAGPSAEQRAKAHFRVRFHGRAGDQRVTTEVRGGDPGYGETSKMLAESALCLAFDRDRLPERAGVLTTAVAMGDRLIERLQAAGITFELVSRG